MAYSHDIILRNPGSAFNIDFGAAESGTTTLVIQNASMGMTAKTSFIVNGDFSYGSRGWLLGSGATINASKQLDLTADGAILSKDDYNIPIALGTNTFVVRTYAATGEKINIGLYGFSEATYIEEIITQVANNAWEEHVITFVSGLSETGLLNVSKLITANPFLVDDLQLYEDTTGNLTQHNALVVANASMSMTADNIAMTYNLVIADATLAINAEGAMGTFPSTPIIDNFNRTTLGASWTALEGSPSISSNELITSSTNQTRVYYNLTNLIAPMEAYVTISNLDTTGRLAYLDWMMNTGTDNKYFIYCNNLTTTNVALTIYKYNGSNISLASLGSFAYTSRTSIKIGAKHMPDGTITAYIDRGAGWEVAGTASDKLQLYNGRVEPRFYASGTVPVPHFDDFGGGGLVALYQHSVLVIQDASLSMTADSAALTQHNKLAVADAALAMTADNLTLTAHAPTTALVIQNATLAMTADNVALTQHNKLTVADAALSMTAETKTLTQHNVLTVGSATLSMTSDNVTLTQHNKLTVGDATLSMTAETKALTQHNILVVASAALSMTADNLALTQHNRLTVADAAMSMTADNLVLTQHNRLTVSDAVLAMTADSLTLTAHEPGASLTIHNAALGMTSDSVALTQHNKLTVSDAALSMTSDNTSLTYHAILAIANATLGITADNVSMTYNLVIQDAAMSMTAETKALTQHNILATNDAVLSMTAETKSLTQHNKLLVDNAALAVNADNIGLAQHNRLTVQNASLSMLADSLALLQRFTIMINNASMSMSADSLTLTQHNKLLINNAVLAMNADNAELWVGAKWYLIKHFDLAIGQDFEVNLER